jgi:hypothetical protein
LFTDHETEPGKFANAKCKKAVFTGTAGVTDGATSMTVHPVYTECSAFGQPATITTTGCDYLLRIGEPTGGGWHVVTEFVCVGGVIVFTIATGTCDIHIEAQGSLTTSQMTNGPLYLVLHTKIAGFKYVVTKDNIGCPLKGTGSFSKGDYNGTTIVKAHDSTTKAAVGITLH